MTPHTRNLVRSFLDELAAIRFGDDVPLHHCERLLAFSENYPLVIGGVLGDMENALICGNAVPQRWRGLGCFDALADFLRTQSKPRTRSGRGDRGAIFLRPRGER